MEVLQVWSGAPNAQNKCSSVDWCIRSNQLDPSAITSQLNFVPSRAWAKGEEHLSKARDIETGAILERRYKYPWGIWGVNTRDIVTSHTAEAHILYLLDVLEPRKALIKPYLENPQRYRLRFYILWETVGGSGGYDLPSALLARMAALCHYVQFSFLDFSPPEEDES